MLEDFIQNRILFPQSQILTKAKSIFGLQILDTDIINLLRIPIIWVEPENVKYC